MKDNRGWALDSLPYRGTFGSPRPPELAALPLPPHPMPARAGLRPLKAWRYVGVFGPELMLCVAAVRVGPARQAFWAVWDRTSRRLHERSVAGRGGVQMRGDRVRVLDAGIQLDLQLDETPGIETVCPCGEAYAWTRKQGGINAHGTLNLDGELIAVSGRAVIDDTAAYYPRHTRWRWSAGVGCAIGGREVAWNLVEGVNDPPVHSERSVWLDGRVQEPGPVAFAPDLSSVGSLTFASEATLARRQNLLLLASDYRQPFGTFAGHLPGGPELTEGYGVMEAHDARW